MSQTVREIAESAAHWIASHYREGIEYQIGEGNMPYAEAVIREELEKRFAAHVLAFPTETATGEGPLTAQCNDCGHWQHSGPCTGFVMHDRPGGPPGNHQCLCKHVEIRYAATIIRSEMEIMETENEMYAGRIQMQDVLIADLRAKASTEPLGDDELRRIEGAVEIQSTFGNHDVKACLAEIRRLQAVEQDYLTFAGVNMTATEMILSQKQTLGDLRAQLQAAGQELEVYKTSYVTRTAYKAFEQLADERGREVERLLLAVERIIKHKVHPATGGRLVLEVDLLNAEALATEIRPALATPAATPPAEEKNMIDPTAQFDSDERLYAAEINLEPCPFCGSKDLSLENLVDDDDFGVSCNKCHIQQISNYTKAEAAQRWNRRIDQREQSNGVWRCQECGEMYDLTSPAWRWDGDKWQHNHGPHIGHVNANYFADAGRTELASPAQEHPDTAVDRVIKYFAELQNDGYDFDGNGWDKEPLRECILEIIAAPFDMKADSQRKGDQVNL